MAGRSNGVKRVCLSGDWTIAGVSAQMGELRKIKASQKRKADQGEPLPLEIDLSGVEAIDASGCQLLVLWLNHLRRQGGAPHVSGVPAEMTGFFTQLGFALE
ncbi:MAG TPA: STAS domain-containing protein [Geobacterales bacterium]|nr:STAS domain-containing protein [Geobacterales bacterium]